MECCDDRRGQLPGGERRRLAHHRAARGPQRAERGRTGRPVRRSAALQRRLRREGSRAHRRGRQGVLRRRRPERDGRYRADRAAAGLPPPVRPQHRHRPADAWAGGFLLAQCCDLCVAAEHATFAISEVKVGRGAPWAAPLPWLIPPRIALQILLTGDPITAARACEVGLVNEVVPLAELRSRTQELAERIAANAPLSVLAAKRTAYLARPDVFDEAERIWAPVYHSADAQEGPAAFRDKRRPVWTGR